MPGPTGQGTHEGNERDHIHHTVMPTGETMFQGDSHCLPIKANKAVR